MEKIIAGTFEELKGLNLSKEQIGQAKKTITIEVEHEGKTYKLVLDGTKGLSVFVDKGDGITSSSMCSSKSMISFLCAGFDSLPTFGKMMFVASIAEGVELSKAADEK